MPFKSEAQRRKFRELVKQGKMSKETLEAWERETADESLPERVEPKRSRFIKKVKVIR